MARPRKTEYALSAAGKIEAAFWLLLEKTAFSKITMQMLAKKAGVNRNTLYYHFANLREVAYTAFQNNISEDVSELFLEILLSSPSELARLWDLGDLSLRIKKIHLYARSESPLLRSILKEALVSRWFLKLGIHAESLSPQEQLQIDYITNGFIGIMGNADAAQDPFLLATFPKSPIGTAVIHTLKQLSAG